jgi:hypothetical protein
MIPNRILRALVILAEQLESSKISWAVTGSTSLALQGVDLVPNDIDILTDEAGAYAISRLFSGHVLISVSFKRSPKYESHFGRLEIDGVSVEIMGDLRVFRHGRWSPVLTPRTRKIENVEVENHRLPVISLASQKDSGYLEERLRSPGNQAG